MCWLYFCYTKCFLFLYIKILLAIKIFYLSKIRNKFEMFDLYDISYVFCDFIYMLNFLEIFYLDWCAYIIWIWLYHFLVNLGPIFLYFCAYLHYMCVLCTIYYVFNICLDYTYNYFIQILCLYIYFDDFHIDNACTI